MKKIVFSILFLPSLALAGTGTTTFGTSGGTIFFGALPSISLDTATFSTQIVGFSPLSWTIPIGGKRNRFVVVGCGLESSDSVSSMSVAGVTMNYATSTAVSGWGTAIYTLTNPPSGTQPINVYLASGISGRAVCEAASFFGVDQVSPVDFSTSAVNDYDGTSLYTLLTTSRVNDALFDVVMSGNAASPSPANGQGTLKSFNQGSFSMGSSSMTAVSIGNYRLGWNNLGGTTPVSLSSIAIKSSLSQ